MDYLYEITGVVIQGAKRGEGLGFPTANIVLHKKIPEGIYAACVVMNRKIYHAAAFVGSAKTFQQNEIKLETHIFIFSGNLYGKRITVKLYKKIRDNKKFESVKELVDQMKKDVEEIKEFFKTNSSTVNV